MPPAGFKRSRALWDNVREHQHYGWWRAIVYEIQPLRYSQCIVHWDHATLYLRQWYQTVYKFVVCQKDISIAKTVNTVLQFVRGITLRQWQFIGGVIVYYGFVRYIHSVLDAGPLVLIISVLVGIFTIGLSDETNRDGLSAYSVFNKGFQKLLGSVDEEALLQQHIGGGVGAMGLMGGLGGGRHRMAVDDEDDDDLAPMERRRNQRRQQQRQQQQPTLNGHNDHQQEGGGGGGGGAVENDENIQPPPPARGGGARKSGKKARRRGDIEQRREIRAQQQAAAAMGFGGGDRVDEMALLQLMDDPVVGLVED